MLFSETKKYSILIFVIIYLNIFPACKKYQIIAKILSLTNLNIYLLDNYDAHTEIFERQDLYETNCKQKMASMEAS